MLASCKFGVPTEITAMNASALRQAEYRICTDIGLSLVTNTLIHTLFIERSKGAPTLQPYGSLCQIYSSNVMGNCPIQQSIGRRIFKMKQKSK